MDKLVEMNTGPLCQDNARMIAHYQEQRKQICITALICLVMFSLSSLAENIESQKLSAIFKIPTKENGFKLSLKGNDEYTSHPSSSKSNPLFFAVTSHTWPSGLIPIYQTRQKDGTMQLTRRLTHGRENFVEPLFFALPLKKESHVAEISGRWSCEATHRDGNIDFMHWEITLIENAIVGRFDQDTDYRFAWLMEGHFNDPFIQLKAEYIDAKYELTGKLSKGQLEGTWRHLEDDDGGTWLAKPVDSVMSFDPTLNTVPLFVIKNGQSNQPLWQIGGEKPDTGSALCRIWSPAPPPESTP